MGPLRNFDRLVRKLEKLIEEAEDFREREALTLTAIIGILQAGADSYFEAVGFLEEAKNILREILKEMGEDQAEVFK